jgi:hypothetical protein
MVNAPVILMVSPVKTYARSAAGKTGIHAAKVGILFRMSNFEIFARRVAVGAWQILSEHDFQNLKITKIIVWRSARSFGKKSRHHSHGMCEKRHSGLFACRVMKRRGSPAKLSKPRGDACFVRKGLCEKKHCAYKKAFLVTFFAKKVTRTQRQLSGGLFLVIYSPLGYSQRRNPNVNKFEIEHSNFEITLPLTT